MVPDGGAAAPPPLWPPAPDARERSRIGRYLSWLETERGLAFAGYDDLVVATLVERRWLYAAPLRGIKAP